MRYCHTVILLYAEKFRVFLEPRVNNIFLYFISGEFLSSMKLIKKNCAKCHHKVIVNFQGAKGLRHPGS